MVPSAAMQAELTVSKSVEDNTSNIFVTIASTPTEITTCYNIFLKQHHLPLLPNSATLNTFIKHLRKNLFFDPIKISVNLEGSETHIYTTITEPTIPDHTVINLYQYNTYGHLPLLSTTSHKQHFTNYLQSNLYNNPNLNLIPPDPTCLPLNLSICTHNV